MDRLRIVGTKDLSPHEACCRCARDQQRWDRIAGKPYCADCQEGLAQGDAPPLVERTEAQRCVVCNRQGTVRFLTYPLQAPAALEMDLCPEHLRALVGRCLEPHAFHQLQRQLFALDVHAEEVFLLHDAFYDGDGRALQPTNEVD